MHMSAQQCTQQLSSASVIGAPGTEQLSSAIGEIGQQVSMFAA